MRYSEAALSEVHAVQAPPVPPASGLQASIEKLILLIEEENDLLQRHQITSHASFTSRKNQALRELMIMRAAGTPHLALPACKPVLERLSDVLKTNAALLKLHIGAVGEISDIIVNGIREAESDGTYGRSRILPRP
jgi:hypothetical protein